VSVGDVVKTPWLEPRRDTNFEKSAGLQLAVLGANLCLRGDFEIKTGCW
jgi:hypothetical protein